MNYYSHHIGDFDRATRHLTRIERSIYRDLIDVYYTTEQQLTLDIPALCRKVIARTDEEVTAVEQVLNEFFIKTTTGWYHDGCEAGIEAYRASTSQKSAAGKASAAKRASKRQQAINGNPTTVEQPHNDSGTDEQLTSNRYPLTSNLKEHSVADATGSELPENPPEHLLEGMQGELLPAETSTLRNGLVLIADSRETGDVLDAVDAEQGGPVERRGENRHPDDIRTLVWRGAKALCDGANIPESRYRSAIGLMVKDYGLEIVLESVRRAEHMKAIEPLAFMKATCQAIKGERRPMNKQEQLEADNMAAAARIVAKHAAMEGSK